MKQVSIFLAAMIISLLSFGQSKTVAEFEEKSTGHKLFLYQSVLRVMNQDKNEDFNMLIRNLDHLRFVSSSEEDTDAKQIFQKIDKGVQGEGFAEIMSFDSPGSKCRVYELESSGGQSTWVATLLMKEIAGVMEMKGSLDLKYLSALSSLDMDRMEELLPLEGKKSNKKN